ncbi:hypothetical protein APHAL10511_000952 [Amanita phalloides]|nr:hypothetical protein APHAL10511_000952 [Amanita phalloides]
MSTTPAIVLTKQGLTSLNSLHGLIMGGKNSPPIYVPGAPLPARISVFYLPPSYGNDVSPTRSAQQFTSRILPPLVLDPLENGRAINVETKEERIRMLER